MSSWCISLRSAVYFGASVYLALGTWQFCTWIMQTGLYLRAAKRPEQASLTWIEFFILLLKATLLPVGCFIFRGVEKEKLSFIKIPAWIFFITKVLQVSLRFYQELALYNPAKRIPMEVRFCQAIDIGAAALFLATLFLYSRRLDDGKEGSDYFKASEVDDDVSERRKSKC